ncbi:hypothetical protein BN77_p10086 [Rhizobium mesoamericanum STM3625]|uniref:histidine kinase n=1 Tax=Rhizobium mesoamericanum STM3625 TaxID=1211777 RepID=K0PNN0_9HYPH|nr:hypothetical protein BN77_p10086 [Rhizobium mesoamericanum STM3625]
MSLAMVAHDLGTNAFKHGFLSVDGGRVNVGWTLDDRMLQLTWIEKGGPRVTEPKPLAMGPNCFMAKLNIA